MTRTRRAGRALVAAVILLLVPAALPGTASAQAIRVDLRLLLVTDAGPSVEALRTLFARVGIPVDVLDLNDPGRRRIDAALLADGAHAHYQGVVLPDHAPPGLSAAELAALYAYERRFGIRAARRLRDGETRRPGSSRRPPPSATAAPSTGAPRS